MDCRDMGALMNAGKRPLGLVFEILDAQYTEENAAWRRSRVLHIERSMVKARDLQLDPGILEAHTAVALSRIADMRALPGGRCVYKVGKGRCRGMSHRFAIVALCRKHHCRPSRFPKPF